MLRVLQKPVAAGNWRKGPEPPRPVRAIVIHVAEGSEAAVDSWFNSSEAKVSAHFLVGLDGEIRQYVGIHDVAYHAGVADSPTWPLYVPGAVNATTIGIEHEGSGETDWPEAQMLASALLSVWLVNRFGLTIDAEHFPLHHEIRAGKSCPGPKFTRDVYLAQVRALDSFLGADIKSLIAGIR